MKHRWIFVVTGAAMGLIYLAFGMILLRCLGGSLLASHIWSGMAAIGLLANMGVALAWSEDGAYAGSAGRLLLAQIYLPLAIAFTVVATFLTPWVFLAAWLVQVFAIPPFRQVQAFLVRRRLRRQITAAGRSLPWDTLEPLLVQGAGVLIVDDVSCHPGLVWWTDDSELADASLLVVTDERLIHISHDQLERGVEKLLSLSQFRARYLDADADGAWLTPLPPGFVESRKFLRTFPHVAVFAVNSHQGRTRLRERS